MIKFENTEVVGWEPAIRGMRNPMNSWDKSDTSYCSVDTKGECRNPKEFLLCSDCDIRDVKIGENDLTLMKNLRKAGTDHRKYLRMINVYVDITAPLYWWKEFDTYKVGTVCNSCSTMHKIHSKEFTLDDFSHEHLKGFSKEDAVIATKTLLKTIEALNVYSYKFNQTKNKKYWWQLIQLLPSSYNQKRTVMINYETLNNIYKSRKNHKLDEWSIGFIDWIKTLPYSEDLIMYEEPNSDKILIQQQAEYIQKLENKLKEIKEMLDILCKLP